jgi:hypothetical protein
MSWGYGVVVSFFICITLCVIGFEPPCLHLFVLSCSQSLTPDACLASCGILFGSKMNEVREKNVIFRPLLVEFVSATLVSGWAVEGFGEDM